MAGWDRNEMTDRIMIEPTMKNLSQSLSACRLAVRFFAGERAAMRHWIGAVLRNNFLYAADSITDEHGTSLRHLIDTLPLPDGHFLFDRLKGGFPKGFFFDCSDLPVEGSGFELEANRVYTFALVLIGSHAAYKPLYVEALRQMLARGFGHPAVPMTLVDITETSSDTTSTHTSEVGPVEVQLRFKTPVCLIRTPNAGGNGFQDKLNNMPTFYQFVRSLTYRLVTLGILYGEPLPFGTRDEMERWIEQQVSPASEAILLRANLLYERLRSTPRVGSNTVYVMGGYAGRLIFGNVPAGLLPVLAAGTAFGVGADINYGLGQFGVECWNDKPKKREK